MRWAPKSSNQVGVVEARFRATIKSSPKPPRTSASLTTSWARSWASLLSKRRSAADLPDRTEASQPRLGKGRPLQRSFGQRTLRLLPGESRSVIRRTEIGDGVDHVNISARSRAMRLPHPVRFNCSGRGAAEPRRPERCRGSGAGPSLISPSAPSCLSVSGKVPITAAFWKRRVVVPPSPARNRPQPGDNAQTPLGHSLCPLIQGRHERRLSLLRFRWGWTKKK